jgi:hypothetical protein
MFFSNAFRILGKLDFVCKKKNKASFENVSFIYVRTRPFSVFKTVVFKTANEWTRI